MTLRPILSAVMLALFAAAPVAAAELPKDVSQFFETYCKSCHDSATATGGFSLEGLKPQFAERDLLQQWVRVHDRIAQGKMPPPDAEQPPKEARQRVAAWLNAELTAASLAQQQATGRVVVRRLNRVEYENTLRDLLGVYVDVKEMLPDDAAAAGFDTVSEGLSISPVHLVRYQEAAEKAIEAAVPWRPQGRIQSRVDGRTHTMQKHHDQVLERSTQLDGDTVMYFAEDTRHLSIRTETARRSGRYRIKASVRALRSEGKPLPVFVGLIDKRPIEWDRLEDVVAVYDAPADKTRILDFETDFKEGERVFFTGWTLPYFSSGENQQKLKQHPAKEMPAPAVAFDWVEIEGPLDSWPPLGYRRLFGELPMTTRRIAAGEITEENKLKQHENEWIKDPYYPVSKDPKADADRLVRAFLPRAFRRPIPPTEADRFVAFAHARLDAGYTFLDAMKATYKLVLCSPYFFCRYEEVGTLDDHAVAARLSYFLWSSMPDDRLLELAAAKTLHEPAVLDGEVERMLKDPKAERFTQNFCGQWLDLRKMMMTKPDRMYPEFDKHLLWSMPLETTSFFNEVLGKDLSLLEFVDSDWSMLNERLAAHYGIKGVHGLELRRIDLPEDAHRGGVMTHASILKVTANGTTTSPIKRGAWVLDRMLGQPPAPPPPNLPAIEPDVRGATTIRQQLEAHRNAVACATCHKYIDPPGFALETYDVIGGWRERYRSGGGAAGLTYEELPLYPGKKVWMGKTVEVGYVTSEGRPFDSVEAYKTILLENPEQIARSLTEKLLIYSTGADIQFADRKVVDEIVGRMSKKNYGFRILIHEVVQSRPFLTK